MFLASENIDFTGLSHVFLLGGKSPAALFLDYDNKAIDKDTIISRIVDLYLANLKNLTIPALLDPSNPITEDIRGEILQQVSTSLLLENQQREKSNLIPIPTSLPGYVAARIVIATGDIRTMLTGNSGHRLIAKHYYEKNGKYKWAGTYDIIDESDNAGPIMRIFQRLCPNGNKHDIDTYLRELCSAKRVRVQSDDKLVWWRNGVWDYRRKTFVAYDNPNFDSIYPEQISITKLPVYHPYGPEAILQPDQKGKVDEPVIHNDKDNARVKYCSQKGFL